MEQFYVVLRTVPPIPFFGANTKKLIHMGLVPAGIWEHKPVDVCPMQRLRIRGQVADMPGKNEHVSLDMFLEVENEELDCELVFSACYSAKSCWMAGGMMSCRKLGESRFQRGFLQQGPEDRWERSAASAEMLACVACVARVGHAFCSRHHACL